MPAHSPLEEIIFPTVQEWFVGVPIVPLSEENKTAMESKLIKTTCFGAIYRAA